MNDERNIVVKPPIHLFLVAVTVGGFFYVFGQYVASLPSQAENRIDANREITVQGRGEVQGKPDVARLSLGIQTGVQPTAKSALSILSSRADAILKTVKASVKEEDVKVTNLSITPQYDYPDGRSILRGFEASETLELKIRDLDAIGTVIANATEAGANNIGGMSFEIDDPKELEGQAKEKAIDDAKENGERLAKQLGVKLGRIKTFTTNVVGNEPPVYQERLAVGAGGAGSVPPTPSGQQNVTATVNITYELR